MTADACYCDSYSYPYREVTRRAAKPHRCCECGARIVVGEQHQYFTGKCEGEWFSCRTCASCEELVQYVKRSIPCFCYEHHNLYERAQEACEEFAREAPGLLFGFYRREVAARRRARQARAQ